MRSPSTLLALLLSLFIVAGCEALIGLKDRELVDNADGGAGANGGKDGGVPAGERACNDYCELVQDACKDEYKVYSQASECLERCKLFTAEEVSCRAQEAQRASASQEYWDHCQAAGPGGSSSCGPNCQSYCEAMDAVCDMPEREADIPTCVRKCASLRDREQLLRGMPANTSRLDVSRDHEGDTLQCRIVHSTIAVSAPEGHCWHAAIAPRSGPDDPINPCATGVNETAPHCEDYCGVLMKTCKEEHAVFEDEAQCLATCGALEPGSVLDDVGKDTVGCRKTHTYNALVTDDFTKHCPHAGPGGAGVCGDDCGAYCTLLEKGCKASFEAKFGPDAAMSCQSQCLAVRGEDPIHYTVELAESATSPLACRLLFATRAAAKPDQADLCASALGEGSCE